MLNIVSQIIPAIDGVLDKFFTDKDQAAQLKHAVTMAIIEKESSLQEQAGRIIEAEANSMHWVTSTWRPALMYTIILIIANNFLFAPYIGIFFNIDLMLSLPSELWNLLTVGVGGYVVGRSAEKVAETWRSPVNNPLTNKRFGEPPLE